MSHGNPVVGPVSQSCAAWVLAANESNSCGAREVIVRATILGVVEDARSASLLRSALAADGHTLVIVADPLETVRRITSVLPDIVILDEQGAPVPGFDLLVAIRQATSAPVIVLSENDEESATVSALDRGADEYVAKPCGELELRSRVRAVLRRAQMPSPAPKTEIVVDDRLSIDFARRAVVVGGRSISLRPTEYRLLYHLVSNAGRVLTHETLLAKVWGYEYRTEENYVRLYVTYLRQKIEKDPRRPRYILNERGLGYRFRDLMVADAEPLLLASSQ
jgi:two-component system KDP operon response regulator KdpE